MIFLFQEAIGFHSFQCNMKLNLDNAPFRKPVTSISISLKVLLPSWCNALFSKQFMLSP